MTYGEHECDFLVVGSGAVGMCAAVTASALDMRVVLAERAPVLAKHGVVLAVGGISVNPSWQAGLFPGSAEHLMLAVPQADGAGLSSARPLVAAVETDLAAQGAWWPVSRVTWPDGDEGIYPHTVEHAKPGVIAVNAGGRRFVNEADGYRDCITAFLANMPADRIARSWLVCDHRFLRRWGLGVLQPWPCPTSHWGWSGYLKSAPTLLALAVPCGIQGDLEATVAADDIDARQGHDTAFGRGESAHNDAHLHGHPCVGSLEHGLFHAVEVLPGSFAGLRTDSKAQVLDEAGKIIAGLFTAGADMASIMGSAYPTGRISLGGAMALGFVAAKAAIMER